MPARRVDPSRILTAAERSARRRQRLTTVYDAAAALIAAHEVGGDKDKALAALKAALKGETVEAGQ
jgi:hypothetical protein